MSNQSKQTPYIYQPFGIQNKEHWATGRIFAVVTDSPLTKIDGLTKSEAEAVLGAIRSVDGKEER